MSDAPASTGARVRHLGEGVYQLATDYPEVCNAPLWTYLVVDDGHFALIDPGVKSTPGATLLAAVRGLGLSLEGAQTLLATHGHPDHSGGLTEWKAAAPTARIGAPLADAPWVESFEKQWVQFWDDYPGTLDLREERLAYEALCVPEPRVDDLLRDGDVVEVGTRRLRVVETRGHTWGHCAYFEEATGFLFTGDAVQGRGILSSDADTYFCPMYVDATEARAGLRRVRDLAFTTLCPAHAEPVDREQGLALLERSLGFIDDVDALTRAYVADCGDAPVVTRVLCERIAALVGTKNPLAPQVVTTARAHLYVLAREGLLDAAWLRRDVAHHGPHDD